MHHPVENVEALSILEADFSFFNPEKKTKHVYISVPQNSGRLLQKIEFIFYTAILIN